MASHDFGTVFFPEMTLARFENGAWSKTNFLPSDVLPLHPAAHVLHYASTCFEGMKAYRLQGGNVGVFRIDDGIKRMQNSARGLLLPVPDAAQLKDMILSLLQRYADQVPDFPQAAYIRPTLIGTEAAVGKAADPSNSAILFVIISPVGDYISSDSRVRVALNTEDLRCAPHFGYIKAGGNYASALGLVDKARKAYDCQQVIFAPKGDVQETAATNCLLFNDKQVLTKPLTSEFLPGITRDSTLKIAKLLGYEVLEQKVAVEDLLEWIKIGELALSGTAATLVAVNELVYQDQIHTVNGDQPAKNIAKVREHLINVQRGVAEDTFSWVTRV